jgi:hypothetical protein
LRSLQEIQLDFEETKAYAELWSQGKKKKKCKAVPVFNWRRVSCQIKHHTTKMYWGSGGIAPGILNLGTRWG